MAGVTSFASIIRSGSATDITKPINTPKTISFIRESNLAKKSPIIEPISETEISTPVKNIPSPTITPTHPTIKFTMSLVSTPTKMLRIKTNMAIGITDLEVFFISSKKNNLHLPL